jgi:hypothetical protein
LDNFLYKVSEIIFDKYSTDFSEICVVFPNRRAGIFFADYLQKQNDKTIWLPKIVSISDLFENISQLQVADNLTLNFNLFEEYIKKTKIEESFDQFYFWGDMLLSDFDEIDKYLVNSDDLFKNISSIKDIENRFDYLTDEQIKSLQSFWKNFETIVNSKYKNDFVSIWELLRDIYNNFVFSLKSKGIAYEGMIYRDVANKIKNKEQIIIPFKKIIFIGFNALTKCEEIYFSYLKSIDKAEFFWDYDSYYYDNTKHEAGFFIRKYNTVYPSVIPETEFDNFKNIPKNIDIYAIPSKIGQVKILGDVLSEFKKNEDFSYGKTAIIFTDESLLIPSLFTLPEDIENINFTMGFPLRNTNVYSLIENLINLQVNLRIDKEGNYKFYFKNVFAILNHQYIKLSDFDEVQEISNNLLKLNKLYIHADDIKASGILLKIFSVSNKSSLISDYLIDILESLYYAFKKNNGNENLNFEQEFIYHSYLIVKQLKEIIKSQNINIDIKIYFNLLKQLVQSKKIPFTGEPLKGLQLMGILETRCLDFDNVIILSMNEGVFPSINSGHSFIPYSLRKGFGLPVIENQNAMYSYYFYRIIQRAKNIALIYNSDTAASDASEMSRFIYQLKFESGLTIKEKSIGYDLSNTVVHKITIQKDKSVSDILLKFTAVGENKKYLSPTSILTWLDCKLKFYFQYVIGLQEFDKITEEIDYAVFGNILHETMNLLYSKFTGKQVNSVDLQQIRDDKELIESSISQAFKLQCYNEIEITGKSILAFEIIKKYVDQIISIDKNIAPFKLSGLEVPYRKNISVKTGNINTLVKIGGKIDRIDILKDNCLRIIDYKTGAIKNSFKDFDELFSTENEKRSNVVFQTFFYSYILPEELKTNHKIVPSVYWIRDSYNINFDFYLNHDKQPVDDFSPYSESFEKGLISTIQDIFNADIPFEQCTNDKICQNCLFNEICYRI